MTSLALKSALTPFMVDDVREFDLGPFSVTLRHFTMSDPKIRAAVERVQRQQRRKGASQATELKADVELFCNLALVGWTLKDDKDKAVPVANAPDVFLGTGQTDPAIIKAGQELYFRVVDIARDPEAFGLEETESDEAEAKNSEKSPAS